MRSVWDIFRQDLQYAARGLLRSPAFTLTALLAIAIGTGAATAVFSVVDRVLFRPLSYTHDDRLVSFGFTAPIENNEFMLGTDYYEWREEHSVFDGMTTWSAANDCDLAVADRPERLTCGMVESTFLPVLGITPLAGRNFTRQEDLPGGPPAALITYKLWRTRFASDPAVVGRTLQLDGQPRTIVGVLPQSFEMPTLQKVDLVLPQVVDPARQQRPNTGRVLRAVGRLKPGVTIEQAKAVLAPYFARSLQFVPAPFRKEVHLTMRPLRDRQTQDARLASWTLLGAVAAVLLIGCANVANLLLARGVVRRREFAVRAALGATRARLLAGRLVESLLLALIGCAAGCAFAWVLLRIFVAIAPDGILRLEEATLDGRVLLFALSVALAAAALFGIGPSLERPRPEELTGVRSTGARRNLAGHTILAAQIAVSLVLISAAALLARSFWKLQHAELGMRPANVFTVPLVLAERPYPDAERRTAFFEEVERRARQLPGVEASAVSDSIPPSGATRSMIYSLIDVEGRPGAADGLGGMVVWRSITPDFFATLGVPIRRGRAFTEADRDPQANTVIFGETLARRVFGNQDPLGQHVRFGKAGPWRTVVGVVGAVKNGGLAAPDDPEYYLPRLHAPDPARGAVLVVRSPMKPAAMGEWIRNEIAGIDRALPVTVEAMEQRVGKLAARPRFNAMLLGAFAASGLLLAAIGLYGVMAFLVAQRRREIGIRMALGATRAAIVWMTLAHAARWTAVGCVSGLAASLGLSRVLKSLLFEAAPQDPVALAAAVTLLVAVVFAAAWLPSRKAAGVEPMEALRDE